MKKALLFGVAAIAMLAVTFLEAKNTLSIQAMPITLGMLHAANTPPTAAFIAATVDNTNLDTYSFVGASIGTANANRLVVVVVHEINGAGFTITHDSMTIGGVTATRDLHNSGATLTNSIFSLNVTSGTTATIDIVTSGRAGSNTDMVISVYTVTGVGVLPTLVNTLQGRAADPSGSITVNEGGVVIAGAMDPTTTETCTWTGVTENSDADTALGSYSNGFASGLTAGSRTITATWTGTGTNTLVAASYR